MTSLMPQQNNNGFTLIEILIVMIIISIVAGIAMITIHTNQRKQSETLAHLLVNTIQLAEQEAMLRPATLGLAFTPKNFQFYIIEHDKEKNIDKWQPLSKPLGSYKIPDDTKITLNIHDETVPANGEPKLIITPSNDLTPFVILIGKQGQTPYYQITGKANGEVTSDVFQAE